MSDFNLTAEEKANVRAAVRSLRAKFGTWQTLAKVLHTHHLPLAKGVVHPMLAFKVARVAKVSVDDVLTGRYPPEGVCRHCGHDRDGAQSSSSESE